MPENNQALFTPWGLARLGLSGPRSGLEALAAQGAGSLCGGEGSREFCATAGLTMWALFPPCRTSVPLRVEGKEELRWEHLPGPREGAVHCPSRRKGNTPVAAHP